MHQSLYFAGFAVVAALAIAAAKWLDDGDRRRARSEARGRSSFPPPLRASLPGDAKGPPAVADEARSSGH